MQTSNQYPKEGYKKGAAMENQSQVKIFERWLAKQGNGIDASDAI